MPVLYSELIVLWPGHEPNILGLPYWDRTKDPVLSFLAILLMSEELEWALTDFMVARAARMQAVHPTETRSKAQAKATAGK